MFPIQLDVSFGGDSDMARSPARSRVSATERSKSVTDITDPSSAPPTDEVTQLRSFSFNFKSFRSISSSHADSSGISESSNSSQTPPPTLEDDESLASSISANKIRAAGRLGSLLSGSLSPIDPTDIAGRTDLADHKIEQTDPLTGIRLRRASCRRSSHKRHSEQGQAPIYPVSPERTDARQADLIAELLDFWTEDQGMSNCIPKLPILMACYIQSTAWTSRNHKNLLIAVSQIVWWVRTTLVSKEILLIKQGIQWIPRSWPQAILIVPTKNAR